MDRKALKLKAKNLLKVHYKEILLLVLMVAVLSIDFFDAGVEHKVNLNTYVETVICYIKILSFEINFTPTSAMISICSAISLMLLIYSVLVGGPLNFGYKNKLKYYALGRKDDFDIFDGFKYYYKKSIILHLLVGLKVFLFALLLIVPGIIKACEYQFVDEVLEEHPEWSYKEIMEESKRLTYGHKWEIFVLELSFILWAILFLGLNIISFGLASYFFQPYPDLTIEYAYLWLKDMDAAHDFEMVQNEETFENLPFE